MLCGILPAVLCSLSHILLLPFCCDLAMSDGEIHPATSGGDNDTELVPRTREASVRDLIQQEVASAVSAAFDRIIPALNSGSLQGPSSSITQPVSSELN